VTVPVFFFRWWRIFFFLARKSLIDKENLQDILSRTLFSCMDMLVIDAACHPTTLAKRPHLARKTKVRSAGWREGAEKSEREGGRSQDARDAEIVPTLAVRHCMIHQVCSSDHIYKLAYAENICRATRQQCRRSECRVQMSR
jgi:hypothetical protein